MRWLLLLGLIALATVARAQEDVELDDEEIDVLESEQELDNVLLRQMFGQLFTFDDDDDEADDLELGIAREDRALEEETDVEQKAVIEPADQLRYNKFMDTFFRRLNADARSSIDPLTTKIVSKNKKKSKKEDIKEGNAKKGGAKKKDDDDKKGRRKDKKPKKGNNKPKDKKKNKNKNKNKNNKKKNKKTGRHPKNLVLDDDEEEDGMGVEVAVAEPEAHHVAKREADPVEEQDDGVEANESGRSADVAEDDSEVAAPRSGKPKNKKKVGKNKKNGNNKKRNNKKGKNKKGKNKNSNKSKRSTKKNQKKGKSNKRPNPPKTSHATVAGIASLVRLGDVQVVDRNGGKELRSEFKIGPVSLKVNRKFGNGKDAIVKSASAESPELTGKMHLLVAANGKAKITKFNILKPSVVTTSGSLVAKQGKLDINNNFLENSIGRIVPHAAKKLKLAARGVLKATKSN